MAGRRGILSDARGACLVEDDGGAFEADGIFQV